MDLGDLDAAATLSLAEREVSMRRRQGVDRLRLLLHWADLHAEDPQARPGAVPLSKGGDRLIQLGGDGTPKASELCWAELAIALETGAIAVRNQAGQALDLRHRLPLLWTLVQELRIEPWVGAEGRRDDPRPHPRPGRASSTPPSPPRSMSPRAGSWRSRRPRPSRPTWRATAPGWPRTPAAPGCGSPGPRPGDLVDPEAEPGTRRLSSKLSAADAIEGDAMVDDLADALALHSDHRPG